MLSHICQLTSLRLDSEQYVSAFTYEYEAFNADSLQHLQALHIYDCRLSGRNLLQLLRMDNLRTLAIRYCYLNWGNAEDLVDIAELPPSNIRDLSIDLLSEGELRPLERPILPLLSNVSRLELWTHDPFGRRKSFRLPYPALQYLEMPLDFIWTYDFQEIDVSLGRARNALATVTHLRLAMHDGDWEGLEENATCLASLRDKAYLDKVLQVYDAFRTAFPDLRMCFDVESDAKILAASVEDLNRISWLQARLASPINSEGFKQFTRRLGDRYE